MSSEEPASSGFLPLGLRARLEDNIGISQRVRFAASFYLRNLWSSLLAGRLSVLLPFGGDAPYAEARDRAFAEFYEAAGHRGMIAYESTTAVPALVASARGVVLDLGPGSGHQLARFDPRRVVQAYGVEPNAAFVPAIAARLARNKGSGGGGGDGTGDAGDGLGIGGDKYTLLAPCGLEDVDAALAREGVAVGELDCVVSMQVMCSLDNLEDHVRHIHRLLKPGGELIFWEHIRSADPVTRAMQCTFAPLLSTPFTLPRSNPPQAIVPSLTDSCPLFPPFFRIAGLWSLVWSTVIGGCRLDRVTRDALIGAAEWEVADFHTDEEPHMMMPRIWGRLVKPRAP